MAVELWTEKHRPKSVVEYVWRDERQKQTVLKWISEKSIPNILLSGSQGLGKTTLVHILLNEIGVDQGDVLEINASEAVDVEMVRTKIVNFASTIPYGDFKVIILEEADGLARSSASMPALKRIMEEYSDTTRFILTTNVPHKIIPPIHSRCQSINMLSLDKEQFQYRLAEILASEKIEADIDTLDSYISACYPDLRKCINSLQANCIDGKLLAPNGDSGANSEYMIKAVELFKRGLITEARTLICNNISDGDYIEVYKFLYRNLHFWGDSEAQREAAIIEIRDGIVKDTSCADREINLSATLVALKNIRGMK